MSSLSSTIPVTLLLALVFGSGFALLAWAAGRALAAVPPEDRSYRDAPPPGFRLLWWPIHWLAHFLQPLLSAQRVDRLLIRLGQAGVDFSLSPAQFIASRALAAVSTAALLCWMLGAFDHGATSMPLSRYACAALLGALGGWAYPGIWLRERIAQRRRELQKTLPFYLDIITLCVEAGLNIQGALNQAVVKGPKGVLREAFQRLLRDIRAGKPRAAALRSLAARLNEPAVSAFVTAVIQAESMGTNLGPILRAQADQRRVERFLRAEKLAMEAPVKLLFPLLAFIFPCTFIVLFFPIAMKFMHAGL
ncbi:type II secretion system F family protein [Noviherbaspirillum pedocola]|uniref:Type II secretion system F family protein n=1 Tax=Noviherbaspirillum pedocola TaxID=2801341 RepID=A0A934SRD1_9BURK|nr:type II secretion system F family protein [Noviherbaspirillum pedocola]MBK4733731.1 type II secretion system F family protein [Noviherbaspirillum pedocola]